MELISPSQKARVNRLRLIVKLINGYKEEGCDFNSFKAMLQFNYGFTKNKIDEYLKVIIDSNQAVIVGTVLKKS